jgi:LmbE family N-acetylglucosaminyl deacetylase
VVVVVEAVQPQVVVVLVVVDVNDRKHLVQANVDHQHLQQITQLLMKRRILPLLQQIRRMVMLPHLLLQMLPQQLLHHQHLKPNHQLNAPQSVNHAANVLPPNQSLTIHLSSAHSNDLLLSVW